MSPSIRAGRVKPRPAVERAILLVEDDLALCNIVASALSNAGYRVFAVHTVTDARRTLHAETPQLVILDLALPDGDGRTLLPDISVADPVPIVMVVSGNAEDHVVVESFDLGVDDFLAKPFGMDVLLARVNRRFEQSVERQDHLIVDTRNHTITRRGVSMKLTPSELGILVQLTMYPGEVHTRSALLKRASEYRKVPISRNTRVVDVHMARLRTKLEAVDASQGLKVVRHKGYAWVGRMQVINK